VSTTQAELVAKFAAGVVDTGGNSLTPVVNLPPVLLTPVVHLDLRPVNFRKKFEMTLIHEA
jgi:hypothetical protein